MTLPIPPGAEGSWFDLFLTLVAFVVGLAAAVYLTHYWRR